MIYGVPGQEGRVADLTRHTQAMRDRVASEIYHHRGLAATAKMSTLADQGSAQYSKE